jgi:Dihydroxyacid dehydratase/phosphogluconate dehydratase
VLHVTPESFVGGPLAFVRERRSHRAGRSRPPPRAPRGRRGARPAPCRVEGAHAAFTRGFGALYLDHVTQADQGCDFDFLAAGSATEEPEIH